MKDKPGILIIDRDPEIRNRLRLILSPIRTVWLADDNRSALEIVNSKVIEVIIMDPETEGISCIDLIKEIKAYDPDLEIIMVSADMDVKIAIKALQYGITKYILKPFSMFELLSNISASLNSRELTLKLKHIFHESSGKKLYPATETSSRIIEKEPTLELARKISHHLLKDYCQHSGNRDYLEFAKILPSSFESKDPYTYGHSERVFYYTSLVTEELDLSSEVKEELQIAAYLHDIGKLGTSSKLVAKRRKLTDEEWEIIRKHPEQGVNLIEASFPNSPNIISYVRHHHERFDGNGYPDGLTGEMIPLGGRTIGIGDAYDAMTSNRPYRKALTLLEAKDELQRCAGTQFDPKLTEIFIAALEQVR